MGTWLHGAKPPCPREWMVRNLFGSQLVHVDKLPFKQRQMKTLTNALRCWPDLFVQNHLRAKHTSWCG
jgi:hypothetical protein